MPQTLIQCRNRTICLILRLTWWKWTQSLLCF